MSNDEGTSSSNDEKDPQLKKFLFKCDQTNQQLEILIPEVSKICSSYIFHLEIVSFSYFNPVIRFIHGHVRRFWLGSYGRGVILWWTKVSWRWAQEPVYQEY